MRLLHSLSFRLALTYVGLFCASVAVLLGFYYWYSIMRPLDEVRSQVALETRELSQIYIVEGKTALIAALRQRVERRAGHRPFHAFLTPDGDILTANLPSWPTTAQPGWFMIEADIYHDGDETDYNSLTRDTHFRDGHRLLVGRDVEAIADLEEALTFAASGLLASTVLLGMVGGLLMSLAIRRRIDAVNRAALTVIEGDLSGRVPVTGSGDDFDRLGETLNLMLGQIEELFEALRRVSDNVAHELRTPLTRLIARLERLETSRDASSQQALLREAIDESHRLHGIFDALLRIARIETGRHQTGFATVDLSALAASAAEFYEPDADHRQITLTAAIEPGVSAKGDPDLLFQAVSNLIDNALKFTPTGGRIAVSVARRGAEAVVAVSDSGSGVEPDEIDRLTERFYRGRRTGGVVGAGLGLSLVAAIAARHDAALRLVDNMPGLRVELVLGAKPSAC